VIIWAGGGGAVRAGAFTYRLGARWVHPQRWERDVRWALRPRWAPRQRWAHLSFDRALGAPAVSIALGALGNAQRARPLGALFERASVAINGTRSREPEHGRGWRRPWRAGALDA
jgi:hypothetical protein